MRRAYIYIAVVAGNILWIVGSANFSYDIYSALGAYWIVPLIVGIFLIMDIAFIKPKNLKYACKSYLKDEYHHDNY